MATFSKPLTAGEPQGNNTQELKPIILIEHPQVRELTKANYHTYNLCTVSYNTHLPIYNLAIPFYDIGSVEEWLKFCKNLQAVITGQSITDSQGIYAITKSMLHGDTLTAFENAKGVNIPQSEQTYKKTMGACVNEMNDLLEQVSPRDNGTPQVKLVEDKVMDILDNAVPKS
eukprot:15358876-Ditylum_brightwellii.AAC.1